MLPLFDMMMQAQNGTAMDGMAKQFGLAREQVAQGMAALMPAFSTGFKRSTTNPNDLGQLMATMISGNYTQYFENMAKTFTPEGISDGNSILGQIFGSKEASRAIAAQAAELSGVGQDVIKQMMPAIATMMMGGLIKQGLGQMPPMGTYWTGNPQANVFEQWMQTVGLQPKPKAPMEALFDNPFTQSFQAFFATQATKKAEPVNAFTGNPFMEILEKMMAPGRADTPPEPQESAQVKKFTDMVNTMFDSGLEVQKNYQKNMDAIFDTYFKATKSPSDKD